MCTNQGVMKQLRNCMVMPVSMGDPVILQKGELLKMATALQYEDNIDSISWKIVLTCCPVSNYSFSDRSDTLGIIENPGLPEKPEKHGLLLQNNVQYMNTAYSFDSVINSAEGLNNPDSSQGDVCFSRMYPGVSRNLQDQDSREIEQY